MTLSMADDIKVDNLPAGFDAYLGYTNGLYNTAADLTAKFPDKPLVLLSVAYTPPSNSNGVDIEDGNYNAVQGVAALKHISNPKPIIYASVAGPVGYSMPDVLNALRANSIARENVRLLSAHYTYQKHICGPSTCNAISIPMDGTQWTNAAFGLNNSNIDVSLLSNNFFDIGGSSVFPEFAPGYRTCYKCSSVFLQDMPSGWSNMCPAGGTHSSGVSGTANSLTMINDGTVPAGT